MGFLAQADAVSPTPIETETATTAYCLTPYCARAGARHAGRSPTTRQACHCRSLNGVQTATHGQVCSSRTSALVAFARACGSTHHAGITSRLRRIQTVSSNALAGWVRETTCRRKTCGGGAAGREAAWMHADSCTQPCVYRCSAGRGSRHRDSRRRRGRWRLCVNPCDTHALLAGTNAAGR